jgi:cytochrome c biogenesis protein CcdA
MDKKQLTDQFNEEFLKNVKTIRIVSKEKSNFTKTKDGKIGDILEQRHSQRSKLFWFALGFVSITTFFVLVVIGTQAYLNFHKYTIRLIEPATLQIIVTGIFVQFVGLVGIITKSIWDDKPYLDAGVIEERKKLYEQKTIQETN